MLDGYRDALLALDEAEALVTEDSAADPFEIGVVNLCRAYVLEGSDRLLEAAACAAKARQAFEDYPDASRQLAASMVQANCLLLLAQTSQAAELAETLVAVARVPRDGSYLGRGFVL